MNAKEKAKEIEKQKAKIFVVGWLVIFPIILVLAVAGWTLITIFATIRFLFRVLNPIEITYEERD